MMRKWYILLCISGIMLLSACAATETNKMTIPELTDREQLLLKNSADFSYVFDYATDQNYTEASLWVEKYEKGVKTAEPISQLSTPLPGESTNGSVILTVKKTIDGKLLFDASISDLKGSAGIHNEEALPKGKSLATLWGSNPQEGLPLSENMLLGSLIFVDQPEGVPVSTLSADFYDQKDGSSSDLEKYDVVYLVKASFK